MSWVQLAYKTPSCEYPFGLATKRGVPLMGPGPLGQGLGERSYGGLLLQLSSMETHNRRAPRTHPAFSGFYFGSRESCSFWTKTALSSQRISLLWDHDFIFFCVLFSIKCLKGCDSYKSTGYLANPDADFDFKSCFSPSAVSFLGLRG